MEQDALLSLTQACHELSISAATGRNWVRLGKLTPASISESSPCFHASYIADVKEHLRSGTDAALKSRRNKTFISGNTIYKSYAEPSSPNVDAVHELLARISAKKLTLTSMQILFLVAECAIRLLWHGCCLHDYLTCDCPMPASAPLLDDLIGHPSEALDFIHANEQLFSVAYHFVPGEDTLGLLYLSLKQLGERKAKGAYYTPASVAKKLIQALSISPKNSSSKTFLDPCCGTGSFLLQLPQDTLIEHVFAFDIDKDSIHIARLNAALHFHTADIPLIRSHIVCRDFLWEAAPCRADYIIGNPPWGYAFSKAQQNALSQQFSCACGASVESYDVFLEHALSLLPVGGVVAFVLPEAILSVRGHKQIRQILLEQCHIRRIDYLGNVFHQVQCPCILLQCEKKGKPTCENSSEDTEGTFSCEGTYITFPHREFTIKTRRQLRADSLSFYADDAQYALLQKIMHTPNALTLRGRADFALGIVTGNNRRMLLDAPAEDSEPILRGCDILPYHIKEPCKHLAFQPEMFQQAAPQQLYRAPEKLVYRFIGGRLVFAYDDKQRLTLNSCNIVIPRIPDMHIKYVLAVLNSTVAQFFMDMQFHSLKMLRSHIEVIPIPTADKRVQEEIAALTDTLSRQMAAPAIRPQEHILADFPAYHTINAQIATLYGLTQEEYRLICSENAD